MRQFTEKTAVVRSDLVRLREDFIGSKLSFDYRHLIPDGCDLVILAYNKGGGYVPFKCLLPHQVYVNNLIEFFDDNPSAEVVYIIPARSSEAFLIAGSSESTTKRWYDGSVEKTNFQTNISNHRYVEQEKGLHKDQ